ncbi:MAG: hypothetical protein FJ102_03230 [Deltaproteobacteria bacterium]|nr:hypothetical protein [Deltaproteobacteria bacterium]
MTSSDSTYSWPRPAAYYSAEGDTHEAEFVAGLLATLATTPGCSVIASRVGDARVEQVLARVSKVSLSVLSLELRQAARGDWRELANTLADGLAGLPPGSTTVIMVDELPLLLARLLRLDRDRAEVFLAWFRKLRQGSPRRDPHLRWLVAGSIGLAPLAARERLTHLINDLHPARLDAYEPAAARALLEGLATTHRIHLDEGEADALLDRLGWPLPYFIQLAVAELRRLPRGDDRVGRVIHALCSVENAMSFSLWWERLETELGAVGAAAAEQVLDACAADPSGASVAQIQELARHFWTDDERERRRHSLLGGLEHDGYLLTVGGRWRFRSPLLREVWLARRQR